ncbi:MAG: nitrogen fixation protein NifM [Candidatus Thiodiazotropha endolucinida]|nr:nitrogen fixation protein NifM [Candidatus Thiodiazotropha endolucinida]
MTLAEKQHETPPEFNYHLLRNSLDGYGKNLSQLDPQEYNQVYRKATRSFDLESLVLSSPEAQGLIIPEQQLDQSVAEVASRYESGEEFVSDLVANGLDESGLRQAIQRELMFDGVMQMVAAKSAEVSDLDMRLFYEMHHERFESPEQRSARHILITVNPEYPENSLAEARARMEQVVEKLAGRTNRFAEFAKRYSECPTAMEGGKLGDVSRGQLYAELDAVLFNMQENQLSPIVESEMGFHLLLCEKIKPGKRLAFAKAAPRIQQILHERQRRNCQKSWLASLRQSANT